MNERYKTAIKGVTTLAVGAFIIGFISYKDGKLDLGSVILLVTEYVVISSLYVLLCIFLIKDTDKDDPEPEQTEPAQLHIEHTQACIDATARYEVAIAEYERLWPNYCHICHGEGQFTSQYDPSPPGISLGSGYMVDYEPCEWCTEIGKCPRCGKFGLNPEDGEGPCSHCGWNYNDLGAPYEPECFCWEVEEREFYRQEYQRLGVVFNETNREA